MEDMINTLPAFHHSLFILWSERLGVDVYRLGWSFLPFSPSQLHARREVGCSVLGSDNVRATVVAHLRVVPGGFLDE